MFCRYLAFSRSENFKLLFCPVKLIILNIIVRVSKSRLTVVSLQNNLERYLSQQLYNPSVNSLDIGIVKEADANLKTNEK